MYVLLGTGDARDRGPLGDGAEGALELGVVGIDGVVPGGGTRAPREEGRRHLKLREGATGEEWRSFGVFPTRGGGDVENSALCFLRVFFVFFCVFF